MDLVPIRQGRINQAAAARRFREVFGSRPANNRWYHAYANVTKPYRPYVHNFTSGKRSMRGGATPAGTMSASGANVVIHRRVKRKKRVRGKTRIRQAALGLFEGKRYVTELSTVTGRGQNNPLRYRMLENMTQTIIANAGGTGTIQDSDFRGMDFKLRGFRVHMLLQNQATNSPVDIRIICGWQKRTWDANAVAAGDTIAKQIYRDKQNKEGGLGLTACWPVDIGGVAGATWESMQVAIDKRNFHVDKEMVVRLGPNNVAESDQGPGARKLQFWWEMNNKTITFDKNRFNSGTASEKDAIEQAMNCYPCIHMYHCNATGDSEALVNYRVHWIGYYKDPLG